MSVTETFPVALLETVLGRLAILFLTGAGGDLMAARYAASQMLAAYRPQTEDEFCLAAEIISFSFQALEALGQAAAPDMALSKILRLRGGAVSLSREAHKAQRRLDQLQRARRIETAAPAVRDPAAQPEHTQPEHTQPEHTQPEPTQPGPVQPGADHTPRRIEPTGTVAATAARNGQTWTQAYNQRQAARRIAENLKKNASAVGLLTATAPAG